MLLGLGDFWVFLAYILCIVSMLFCVCYASLRWNTQEEDAITDDVSWLIEEAELEKTI